MENIQPKNYLLESILVTLFCCLPFGIVGIVYASQVNTKFSLNDYEGAKQASKEAGKWVKWGFISGLIIFVLYIAIVLFIGGLAFLENFY